jgi:hypothetical protein
VKRFHLLRSIFVVSPVLLLSPDTLALECSLISSTSQVWDTGFRAEYLVTNNKSQAINGWSVQLNTLNGTLQTNWDSVVSSASPITFNNAGWNGVLQPGASVKFGFLGAKTGDFTFPGCVDALIANMTIPQFVDPTLLETGQSGGFSWQSVAGAVRYDIEEFLLDEAGQPAELLSAASTVNTSWGFSNSSMGHFGWRVRQCDADDNCSAFSDFKRVIKFSLRAPTLNRVTGTYDITWASPFSDSVLLENGNPVADPSASGSVSFRDRDSGTYTYSLSTLNSTFQVVINRFDPDINTDRSLMIHDQATLNAANISLADIFTRFAEQLSEENPADPIDGNTLFSRMWDAQNSAETSLGTGATPCEPQHLGDATDCPRTEATQAADPALFLSRYVPIAMVNRLDLRDRLGHEHCGEARMIFALPGDLGGRNFLIFEAEMPNPLPGNEAGCLPIAQFWHQLSTVDSAAVRGQRLRDFYLNGLPARDVQPVFTIDNFTSENGQIRTNQFSDFAQGWNLKEYKISTDAAFSTLEIVTVKNNPMASLFDMANGTEFLQQFSNGALSLVGGISFISMPAYDDRFNNIESHASGNISENQLRGPFEGSRGSQFEDRILVSLSNVRSNLNVEQVINRAVAMTCGGCHQPSSFGLTDLDAVGPGLSWPNSAGFVHVDENAFDGIFPLSQALTDVFLPDRLEVLEAYLSTGAGTAPIEPVQPVDEAEETPEINNGDRSG